MSLELSGLSDDAHVLHGAFLAAQAEGRSTTLLAVRRRAGFDHARAYIALVELKNAGHVVDFGAPAPGTSHPMPDGAGR